MPRPKKQKKAGDHVSFKLKDNERQYIVDWFNCQTSISNSLRYLIEQDYANNGIRDIEDELRKSFSLYQPNGIQSEQMVPSPPLYVKGKQLPEVKVNDTTASMPSTKKENAQLEDTDEGKKVQPERSVDVETTPLKHESPSSSPLEKKIQGPNTDTEDDESYIDVSSLNW
ncbi:hypothetical protein [Bacillus sp. UMB0728]|uniref:hypothetical protein n=1 Tax=Bacillus sp. UMB0728 TaxID=2066052 RepID=UPI000C791011|nr:hypothetical protein [Bacillus sp. UMB0728]PLR70516.1 hypothetical protein CYJ37_23570 [Bacillus sp. UMB0728]